jgi:hypothetical protein
MHVPASTPGRLLFEYVHRRPDDPSNEFNPYRPYDLTMPPIVPPANDPNIHPYSTYRAPFGHLLNFFNTTTKAGVGTTTQGANYYRLLDFVEVPSRFAGTEKWFNPDTNEFRTANPAAGDVVRYRPPFNWLSRFSDPGRVNLNTIWDPRVWLGVSEGFPLMATATFWNSAGAPKNSIQETLQVGAGTSPSEYPNPFRAAGSAMVAPTVPGDALRHDGVEATLLRSQYFSAASATPLRPLFNNDNMRDVTMAPHNLAVHPGPNAYFRYQGLQRLGNLVSSQSNVFAVWVTVGFFEVERSPAGNDAEHPDGYLLGPGKLQKGKLQIAK